jgi:hypothetical protein
MVGCNSVLQIPTPPGIQGAQFDDIPVPVGFEQDSFESYGHIYPRFRVYTLVYYGLGSAKQIVNFYKRLMPKHGWRLQNELTSNNVRQLDFRGGLEVCRMKIIPQAARVTLRIELGLR